MVWYGTIGPFLFFLVLTPSSHTFCIPSKRYSRQRRKNKHHHPPTNHDIQQQEESKHVGDFPFPPRLGYYYYYYYNDRQGRHGTRGFGMRPLRP